ncbi:cytochrome C [Comamonas guangdongensis]|uniref:Cytochrome C n=1 Tax=Comamonas guangdongensis TaxID=510515 RepID=A0ABV4A1T8_9BURK
MALPFNSVWARIAADGRHRCALWAVLALLLLPQMAEAIPLFARQTGQNCMACHAGGQFPELTAHGRLFKLTGYTMGERTVPLSIMGVVSNSRVANTSKSDDPASDFQRNGKTIFATGSVFLGGKITDNLGALAQITYDPYATQGPDGRFHGHSHADNMDVRYADRFISPSRDLIVGVSFNNNPSVSDPWNTAAAWMQYVPVPTPTSSRFIDGTTPYPSFASGGNLAGLTAYAYWNQSLYAEFGGYATSRGPTSFMSSGVANANTTKLRGLNPYLRLAWNRDWGAHNLMLGTSWMSARIYDNPLDTSDPSSLHRTRDWKIDAQYQYLLDPHAVTAQLVFAHNRHRYPDALANQPVAFTDVAGNPLPLTNAVDRTNLLRAKLSYVYQARYGASIALFNLTGSTNTANQTSGYDPGTLTITSDPGAQAPSLRVGGNLSGNPAVRGMTLEAFWMPFQYMRLGAQYTAYSRYNGASSNYDGLGRNARDNNSLFLYIWAAY